MKNIYKIILLVLLIAFPIIASIFAHFGLDKIALGLATSHVVVIVICLFLYLDNGFAK